MYELFIANKNYSSWSLRPWLLMRESGIAFNERLNPFTSMDNHDNFRSFSPSGQVPCLHDNGVHIWDSLAICEYLSDHHPGLWPLDPTTRAWARCATAEMHAGFSALRNICTMNCGLRIRLYTIPPALQKNIDRLSELFNEGLARFGGPYLAGRAFSIVDAFYGPVAFRVQTYDLKLDGPAAAYVQRILALPSMLQWHAAAVAETMREETHEAEARAVGEWVEDLRAK
jgi:glutathione S-transferase